MRKKESHIAHLNARNRKEQHERNTGNDLGVEHRQVNDTHHHLAGTTVNVIQGNCSKGSKDRGDDGCQKADGKCCAKCRENLLIREQLFIPPKGESSPARSRFAVIEGIQNQEENGRIQKEHDETDIYFSQLFQMIRTSF